MKGASDAGVTGSFLPICSWSKALSFARYLLRIAHLRLLLCYARTLCHSSVFCRVCPATLALPLSHGATRWVSGLSSSWPFPNDDSSDVTVSLANSPQPGGRNGSQLPILRLDYLAVHERIRVCTQLRGCQSLDPPTNPDSRSESRCWRSRSSPSLVHDAVPALRLCSKTSSC